MLALDEKYKQFEDSLVLCEASHPGETLETELEARGISYPDFAIMTKLPLDIIQDLIDGKIPVTEEIAEKLYEALGIDTDFWIRRQLHYEYSLLVLAEREKEKKLKATNVFKRITKPDAVMA